MDGWMDGWSVAWMHGRLGGCMVGCMDLRAPIQDNEMEKAPNNETDWFIVKSVCFKSTLFAFSQLLFIYLFIF